MAMIITEFGEGGAAAFLKAERYVNDGSPSGFSWVNQTSNATSSRCANHSFKLQQVRFDWDPQTEDIGSKASRYLRDGGLFIHPDMLVSGTLLDTCEYSVVEELSVAPTASERTVYPLGRDFFVKLAYASYLGRVARHMSADMIRSACQVTSQLTTASRADLFTRRFGFLREDCGRVLHIPRDRLAPRQEPWPCNARGCYEMGVVFRDFRPFPYVPRDENLIPFFALISSEHDPITGRTKAIQDKPLLIQLCELHGKPIDAFLLEDILFPLFTSYFEALIFAGVELEAHSQNVLLAIDHNFAVTRIVFRDMESAGRDVPLMALRGVTDSGPGYKCNLIEAPEPGERYSQYHINHSFMFDFKLGEYLVSPLIAAAHQHIPFDTVAIMEGIKDFNRRFISRLPLDFFPPDWCHYEKVNWRQSGRRKVYIWQTNPRYR